MLNRKLIVAFVASVGLFFGIYSFAQTDDTEAPVITLKGDAKQTIEVGSKYVEKGATAIDDDDTDLTDEIIIDGKVDENKVGTYKITYNVSDSAGNDAEEVVRTVYVVDTTSPVITLNGQANMIVRVHSNYVDAGVTVIDNYDKDIVDKVSSVSNVNTNIVGVYTVTYDVTDSEGNVAQTVVRTVNVVDTTAPIITLLGAEDLTIEVGSTYTDAGATASDNYNGNITNNIEVTSEVNPNIVGTYTVKYNVSDGVGNAAIEVVRTVNVVDTTAPIITLLGAEDLTIEVGSTYTDAGATALDNYDNDITNLIVVTGSVDPNKVGAYTITYDVIDSNGNVAQSVVRTVNVVDDELPLISLVGEAEITVEVGDTYIDEGAIAVDNYDGDISGSINVTGVVDTTTIGLYTITYNVIDSQGNAALEVTRKVHVEDSTAPVITFDPASSSAYAKSYSVIVSASDNYSLDEGSLKYIWTDTEVVPLETVFIDSFINGSSIASPNLTGTYYLWILAKDNVGNKTIQKSEAYYLDNTAPTIPTINLNGYTSGEWTNQSIAILYSSTDDHSGILKYQWATMPNATDPNWRDINPSTSFNVGWSVAHNLYIRAVDKLGNKSAASQLVVIKSDRTAPQITFTENENDVYAKNHTAKVKVTDIPNPNPSSIGSGLGTLKYIWSQSSTSISETDFATAQSFVLDTNNEALIQTDSNLTGTYYLWILAKDNVGNKTIQKSEAYYLDNTAPTIKCNGSELRTIWEPAIEATKDREYVDNNPFVVTDNAMVGELSPRSVSIRYQKSWNKTSGTYNYTVSKSKIDLSVPGIYRIDYNYIDTAGNTTYATKYVPVQDTTNPTITLNSTFVTTYNMGSAEPNWADAITMNDNSSLPLEFVVEKPASFDMNIPNIYTVVFKAKETNTVDIYETWDTNTRTPLESASLEVTITIIDHLPPTIEILGANPLVVNRSLFTRFSDVDPGVNITDNYNSYDELDITVTGINEVNMRNVGEYNIVYTVTDLAGNTITATRTVKIIESVPPVILLNYPLYPILGLDVNKDTYVEYGASAYDIINGQGLNTTNLTNQIVTTGNVDTTKLGTYYITYSVTDWSGNRSSVTRTIEVKDKSAPVITLSTSETISVTYRTKKLFGGTKTITIVVPKGIAVDNYDGDVSNSVQVRAYRNSLGKVKVEYSVTDAHNNNATETYNYNDID